MKEVVKLNLESDDVGKKLKEVLESNNNEKILMFNKESGAFVGTVVTDPRYLDSTYYKWKILHFDSDTYTWVGDFDSGKLVKIEEQPTVITEAEVDAHAGEIIKESYPWFSQINILISVVKKLVDANAITGAEVDEFNEMVSFIEARRDVNRKYKDAYQSDDSFIFKTRRDEWNELADQMAGGLHEKLATKTEILKHNNPDADVDQIGHHY